jgi:hypothetical protein
MSLMRKTDFDALTPGQQWRLRIALDRVMPPFSPPRYQARRASLFRPWRFAPATLALAITGVLALSAYAATGSANPAVWGQRAESTIQAVRLIPAATPGATGPSSSQPPAATVPGPAAKSQSPSPRHPESSDGEQHDRYAEPPASPEPSGSHHHWNPPSPSPKPSPSPSPSPSPDPPNGG